MAELPQVPGYKLLKVLKQSKRSRTFLAEQQSLARQVALKVLSEEFFDDPALRQRFVDEGKSAARLNHPHVLAVFDIGSAGGFPFIATEFVPGGTLRERMQQPMAPVEALRIVRDLASALEYAHSQGVIHRDIKPSNIMFRADGAAVLGDLGILKAQSGGASMQIGSPHYMSPEQIEGEIGDGRADLYSLGIVLYEMLTGRPPFDAEDPFVVIGKHLSEKVPKLPEALALYQSLIDRTLAKKPEARFATARELVLALDNYIEPKTIREPRLESLRSATKPVFAPMETLDLTGPATVVQPAVVAPIKATAPDPVAEQPRAKPIPATVPVAVARKSNPLKAVLRIGLVLAVLVAIIYGLVRLFSSEAQPPQSTAPAIAAQLGGTQSMAETELKAAEALIEAGAFFAPAADNAWKRIEAASAAQASGARLNKIRLRLGQRVAERVLALRKQGDKGSADALLKEARARLPGDSTLASL
ncbi:MAG: serine/threonine protein kinase [Xanthomonadales bacterium]|nr:Serine/threonine-protein kinase PknD [Xanthomonadales bacterium]MCC6591792.1 serine/threonine protein kinase [Xanthomonadales bacterium]